MRALSGSLPILAVLAVLLGGCTAVEHCTRGTVGCAGGPADDAGSCRLDLIARTGMCITPAEAARYGDGGRPRPQPDPCGPCPAGKTCASDQKLCIDFCAAPAVLPGSMSAPEPIRCGGERDPVTGKGIELSFDETCISNCELECRSRGWFCKSGCPKDACAKPEVLADCHARCDKTTDPLSCVQSLCTDARATGCAAIPGFCPGDEMPDCSQVTCSNRCPNTAFDGVCDDGDLDNAAFASCEWGTDCADCGPRMGEDMSRKRKQGDLCDLQEQCAGSSPNFAQNGAFCAAVGPGKPFKRCLLDCSGKHELCPVGSSCTTLEAESSEGVLKPVTDFNQVEARACLPDACR